VWWDPEISPGQEFDRQITAALKTAAAVVVVWTPTSVESRWVRGEARDAADRGILVPARFEGAELPIDVRAIHTTDLDGWGGNFQSPQVRELLRALGAIIASRGGTHAAPAASPLPAEVARIGICVLPFANMSGDSEQEYFSDGISEDVITDLNKVSSLFVVARNTAFTFKGKNIDVAQLARQLKVSHVLEGSVRKAGGRVRITAQLIEGSSGGQIWAERYDRDLNDIFALQDEISEAIVKALRLKLLPEEKNAIEQRGTDNVEAYNLYLMALGQMLMHFAHGQRADDGLAAAERALALDNDLAEAHAVKARILSQYGRHDEAEVEIDIALRLDPESYEVNKSAAYLRVRQHRLKDAIPFYEKAMTLMETDVNSPSMLKTCYAAVGDTEAVRRVSHIAFARAEKILERDPSNGAAMGYGVTALARLGERERAKEWINRALLIDPDNMNMRYNFACALTVLKENEAAIDVLRPLLESAYIDRLNHAKVDADLDPLREDPRFKKMIADAEARLAGAGDGSAAQAS